MARHFPIRSNWQNWLLALGILAFLAFSMANGGRGSFPQVSTLSVPEARTLVDSGVAVIDVRGEEAFARRHIPGAINIPLAVLQLAVPASLSHLKDKQIVVYCNDGVRSGPEATRLLNTAGYANAANMQQGIEGWVAAGHAVARQGQ